MTIIERADNDRAVASRSTVSNSRHASDRSSDSFFTSPWRGEVAAYSAAGGGEILRSRESLNEITPPRTLRGATLPLQGRVKNTNPFSRRVFFRARVCSPKKDEAVSARPFTEAQLNGGLPAIKGKAEHRKAHCPTNVRDKRGVRTVFSSAPTFRRSRLRHSPPASTPMAQLQNRVSRGGRAAGVSPASPTKEKDAAVKHAPCGLVLVPVDR